MIKDKYKPAEVIKERNGKVIERAYPLQSPTKTSSIKTVVLKSYPAEDAKSIEN